MFVYRSTSPTNSKRHINNIFRFIEFNWMFRYNFFSYVFFIIIFKELQFEEVESKATKTTTICTSNRSIGMGLLIFCTQKKYCMNVYNNMYFFFSIFSSRAILGAHDTFLFALFGLSIFIKFAVWLLSSIFVLLYSFMAICRIIRASWILCKWFVDSR